MTTTTVPEPLTIHIERLERELRYDSGETSTHRVWVTRRDGEPAYTGRQFGNEADARHYYDGIMVGLLLSGVPTVCDDRCIPDDDDDDAADEAAAEAFGLGMERADAAIKRSAANRSGVTLDHDENVHEALQVACDSFEENADVTAFWGFIENGEYWRVEMKKPHTAA